MARGMTMPIIRLDNGIHVANFSSPHSFRFVTGEVLPACSPERANYLMLGALEHQSPGPGHRWTDIAIEFTMSAAVADAVLDCQYCEANVILVPLPVMQAAKCFANEAPVCDTDFEEADAVWRRQVCRLRCIRVADRVTKTIYPDRFCI